jgi:integrase
MGPRTIAGEDRPLFLIRFDQWLVRSGIGEAAAFQPISRRGHVLPGQLSGDSIAYIVKQRVRAIGLDPTRYSGHSLRAGFVTGAPTAGAPAWIKAQTGHVSDALVGRYIRLSDPFAASAVIATRGTNVGCSLR